MSNANANDSESTPLLRGTKQVSNTEVIVATVVGNDDVLTLPASNHKSPSVGPLEISPSRRRLILTGIWMGTFLSSLNSTLVATLVSSISSEYKAANQASWLGTGYLLATCTFTPLYGRLCDMMGRRRANQTAVLFAGLGTLSCGLSTNMPMLIAARFLSGVGGGGCYITCSVITSDMYSLRHRSLTQGIASVFNAAGQGFGGPIGGYISDRFGWRWAFLLQMPLYVISFLLTEYNLNYVTPGKSKNTKETLKRIDYGGSISLLLSVRMPCKQKYNEELPWNTPCVLVTLIMSIVMFITFLVVELCIARQPILAPSLLKQRVPVSVGISNLLMAASSLCCLYFFPMFFETVMLTSASVAGLHLFPKSIAMTSGALFAGVVMSKTGSYNMLSIIGGLGPILSTFLLAGMNEHSSSAVQWLSIVPLGLGNAIVSQTTLIALLAHVDQAQIAVATGFGQLWKCIGQVVGVAIPSAIFQYLLTRELTARITGPDSEEIIARIRHSSRLVQSLPPDLQRPARDSYSVALGRVFWYVALSTVMSFVIRLMIPGRSLDDSILHKKKEHAHASVDDNHETNGRTDIERPNNDITHTNSNNSSTA
ncbi:hypothetical protein Clacol_006033 [Clathrus columnatus]|uniref:Major facilitator superfamily (MFS) profile domain-containing protein n=1 Tax=Clathrus columnatus TaxID=1419009 RepID=A0AAV5AFW9_9AGAM|nr:hypothetical protein Clacol_006033 [Clathrus columnatus]